jgi:hypothetical protein
MDREILSIIMLVVFLLLVGLVIYLNNTNKVDSAIKQRIWADLLQVKAMVETKNSLIYRDILIRLDSLLSKALKLYYKNSESCGTNLKQARDLFNNDEYNKIWKVHKLRNQVVHENKEISSSELMESYSIISSAIKKLLYEK